MAKHLIIAGHGRRKNGTFDPGATGIISKGEHRYMKENLFPAMKKYADDDFIFFSDYNVYSHKNIVALAKKYNADTVTEFHYDAGSAQASGGHVIVYSHYKPDDMDLRIRDAVKSMVGVRYNHAGERGISGRSNLANVKRTASGRVNYRMVELGFGTNKRDADILMNKTDEYAKKLVEAIKGGKVSSSSTPIKPSKPSVSSGGSVVDYMNKKGMDSSFGNRKKLAKQYGVKNYKGTASQNISLLNKLKGGKPKSKKSIAQMAKEVIDGKHSTGHANRRRSLNISQSEYNKVHAEVNRLAGVKSKPRQSVEQMANRIINDPKAPNGHSARRKWLGIGNATYQKVRARVNQKLR